MAKKKKSRNRANKVKGRLPTKKISEPELYDIASKALKFTEIDGLSCFEISRPSVGAVFKSNNGLLSRSVEQCSERDEVTGDFQVTCFSESGQKMVLTAKQWANNLVLLEL